MIVERASINIINPTKGRTYTVFVRNAITPNVIPRLIAPVSPMKNLAGKILNHKKAKIAPVKVAQKIANE